MAEKRPPAKDLRAVPEAELRQQLETLRQELWQSRLKVKDGSLQQTHQVMGVRRQIARVLTVLSEPRGAQRTSS